MIGMIQMPLVHVMAHPSAEGNNTTVGTGQGNESFLAKLTALMQGDGKQLADDESGMSSEQMDELIAKLIAYIANEQSVQNNEEVAHMIAAFMTIALQGSGDSQQQTLTQANIQQWLQQAEQLVSESNISQHATQSTVPLHQTETNVQHGRAVAVTVGELTSQQQALSTQVQKVVAEFLELAQHPTHHTAYDQHARALKDMLRMMLASNGVLTQQHVAEHGLGQPSTDHMLVQQRNSDLLLPLHNRIVATTVNVNGSGDQTTAGHAQTLEGLKPVQHQQAQMINQPSTSASHAQALIGQDALVTQVNSEPANNGLVTPFAQHIRVTGTEQQPAQPITTMQAQYFAEEAGPLVIKQLRFAQLNGGSEARIALVPEHLGHLNIHIAMKNGQMVAQFIAESVMGKEMIEAQLTQLRTMLQGQGIQVEKLEVLQGQQTNLFQQPREQHDGKPFSEGNKNRKPNYEAINDDFSLDFREDSTPNSRMYGSSFEAVI